MWSPLPRDTKNESSLVWLYATIRQEMATQFMMEACGVSIILTNIYKLFYGWASPLLKGLFFHYHTFPLNHA